MRKLINGFRVVALTALSSQLCYAQGDSEQVTDKNQGKVHHKRGHYTRIIGGTEVTVGAYPYMTSMQSDGRHFCGASFLGDKWVLTAAHCVGGQSGPGNGLEVVIGGHDLTDASSGTRVSVKHIYSHESYGSPVQLNNDIALLELTESVDKPSIEILSKAQADALVAGTSFTVTGWGNTSTTEQVFSDKLMEVNVPLVSNEICNAEESYAGGITEQMVCAGLKDGGKDSCQGDSGGPLVLKSDDKFYQVGIVSFGEGCAQADKYGVYAAAAQYHDWINSTIKGLSFDNKINFGAIEESGVVVKTIKISNNGEVATSLSNSTLQGDGADNLAVDTSACAELAANASCELKVTYTAASKLGDDVSLTVTTTNTYTPTFTTAISASFLAKADATISAAADGSDIQWFNDANHPWEVQSTEKVTGESGLKAGSISDGQSTTLMAKVTGPAKFLFNVKVSSEKYYDFLDVFFDGGLQFYSSGESNFEGRFFIIPEGEHRITFQYKKDELESGGNDTIYLDGVERVVKPKPVVVPPKVVQPKKSSGGSSTTLFLALLMFAAGMRARMK